MFSSWHGRVIYVICAIAAVVITTLTTRPGFEESLQRPITKGFGPPCTLWQAWKLFCSFFWEQMLLIGVVTSCAIRLYFDQWHWADLLIAMLILAVFPFQEYFIHMFFLHKPPFRVFGQQRESLAALVHRVHHRDPWHMERAINPPVAVVMYAVGLPILFFPFLPRPQAMTGVAASWLTLLAYEWIHLLIHTSHAPKNWLYKRIWRNHRLHHFKNEHYWYNVSTYGIDLLFHTNPKAAEVPTSPTCLTLDEREAVSPNEELVSPNEEFQAESAADREAAADLDRAAESDHVAGPEHEAGPETHVEKEEEYAASGARKSRRLVDTVLRLFF